MATFVRPERLRAGDRVAALTASWGGPASFPHIYEAGVRVLRERFGLDVIELPTTRADDAWLSANPAARGRQPRVRGP